MSASVSFLKSKFEFKHRFEFTAIFYCTNISNGQSLSDLVCISFSNYCISISNFWFKLYALPAFFESKVEHSIFILKFFFKFSKILKLFLYLFSFYSLWQSDSSAQELRLEARGNRFMHHILWIYKVICNVEQKLKFKLKLWHSSFRASKSP
jgi:hypothetical protein